MAKAAELLDLVDTPKQDIVLTTAGEQLVASDASGRKRIFREKILGVSTFTFLAARLERAPRGRVPAEVVVEELAMHLPDEPSETLLQTLIAWGRYGELIGFDPETRELYVGRENASGLSDRT